MNQRCPEEIAWDWITAFNYRDPVAAVTHLAADARVLPFRLPGLEGTYVGRKGVCDWFSALERRGYEYQIVTTDVREAYPGIVIARGYITSADDPDANPVWARIRVEDGAITSARHYVTEVAMGELLGVSAPAPT